jgi:metal-responsive CopG/Arc/MetJ family transcriptional regulator
MMRTLVDLPEPDIRALDQLGQQRRVSRAKIIRQAVRDYLAKTRTEGVDSAFGLWRDQAVDGLEYQRKLRDEW